MERVSQPAVKAEWAKNGYDGKVWGTTTRMCMQPVEADRGVK